MNETPRGRAGKRFVGVLVALVLGIGAALVVPTAAQAAREDCPDESGFLCFWVHEGYSGARGQVSGTNANWNAFSQWRCAFTGTWDNCASAIWNEGLSCEAVVYENANYGGASWVINRDTGTGYLSLWSMKPGYSWNEQISSNSWFC